MEKKSNERMLLQRVLVRWKRIKIGWWRWSWSCMVEFFRSWRVHPL